jgi:hypothetical protein
LPDPLFQELKILAARRGSTFKRLVRTAVENEIEGARQRSAACGSRSWSPSNPARSTSPMRKSKTRLLDLNVWLAKSVTDPVVYFVIFWLPEYLHRERNFDLSMIGKYAWVPFIFGDIGYVLGGWLSGFLIRRGWPLLKARRAVLALGAMPMLLSFNILTRLDAEQHLRYEPSEWLRQARTQFRRELRQLRLRSGPDFGIVHWGRLRGGLDFRIKSPFMPKLALT